MAQGDALSDHHAPSGRVVSAPKIDSIYESPVPHDSIRLLKLHPRSATHDGLEGTLLTFTLARAPMYAAASYMWGVEGETRSIIINGARVHIRENLWCLLAYALLEDEPILVWADAICINQGDLGERNRQVQMMGAIYRKAEKVMVWLGEEEEGSGELFRYLNSAKGRGGVFQNLTSNPVYGMQHLKNTEGRGERSRHLNRNRVYEEQQRILSNLIYALAGVCGRKYWTRTWIMQECILARSVMVCCGREQVAWDTLCQAISEIVNGVGGRKFRSENIADGASRKYRDAAWESLRNAMISRMDYERKQDEFELDHPQDRGGILPLLRTCKATSCADVRDKIYGILSLITDHRHVPVDYGIRTEQLWARTVTSWATADDVLRVGDALRALLGLSWAGLFNESRVWDKLASEVNATVQGNQLPISIPAHYIGAMTLLELKPTPNGLKNFLISTEEENANGHPIFSLETGLRWIGTTACSLQSDDMIFAFEGTAASLVFREIEEKLVCIDAAFLTEMFQLSDESVDHVYADEVCQWILRPDLILGIKVQKIVDELISLSVGWQVFVAIGACFAQAGSWERERYRRKD
jgi:Heterokaryon incompatibility protein (HET)